MKTHPPRLAQTFKKHDLVNEMNKTRVIKTSDDRGVSLTITKGVVKSTKSSPKISSWIDPKSVKGTPNDVKKMEEWIVNKDKEKIKRLKEAKKAEQEIKKRKQEEEKEKIVLQQKNFELWESKKKSVLEQKVERSEKMKARKKEKQMESLEKRKDNDKVFENWKSNKEGSLKVSRKADQIKKKEEEVENERLKAEKKRDQKNGFEMWCQRQAELEKQKKEAEKAAKEAEEELELLEEYRKLDAEEEYEKWQLEKSLRKSQPIQSVEHRLAWAPAGKSDGKHRTSPNSRPLSPGEPLSKTLATLKDCPTFTRKLKTVDVCCRQISFWCHCQSENGFTSHAIHENGHFQRSPQTARTSTPKMWSPVQLSRHTTPVNSRPSTPVKQ